MKLSMYSKIPLAFIGFGLALISALCTSFFLYDIPTDQYNQRGAFVAGFLLEGGKFYLIPLSVLLLLQKRKFAGISFGLVGSVLLVISVLSSIAFLQGNVAKSEEQASVNKGEYDALTIQIEKVNNQIDAVTLAAKNDASSKYHDIRERSKETLKQIPVLQTQAGRLINIRKNVKSQFSTNASVFSDEQRAIVFITLSIMLDVVGLACFIALSLDKREREHITHTVLDDTEDLVPVEKVPEVKAIVADPSEANLIEESDNVTNLVRPDFNIEKYQELVGQLKEGKIEAKVVSIMKFLQFGHGKTKIYVTQLVDDGIIQEVGQGYALA